MSLRRACLVGHPVAHSRSPLIHNYWLRTLGIEGVYELKDVPPAEFADFLQGVGRNGYVGCNVTVPHKEAAFRLVHARDAAAEAVGAVNTVWREGARLVGGNSDVHGFLASLDAGAAGWDRAECEAVVLGAGGAGRAAAFGLTQRGARVHIVNRTLSRAREIAGRFAGQAYGFEALPRLLEKAGLLVNCTSLGLAGKPALEIDLAPLRPGALVCDMNYVPLETPLLEAARRRGHRTVDGLGMLLHQADLGFRKWFGGEPRVTAELRALVEADLR